MKLENIIKELEFIKTIDDDQEGLYHYNKLIETLKNDLALKEAKKTTSGEKITAIKKVINNKRTIERVYHGTIKTIDDNKMMFTDSYSAYIINKIDGLFEEAGETYPDLRNFFKNINRSDQLNLNLADIKATCKTTKKDELVYIQGMNLGFNPEYLLNFIKITGDGFNYYKHDKLLYAINYNTNEEAILLGCKECK